MTSNSGSSRFGSSGASSGDGPSDPGASGHGPSGRRSSGRSVNELVATVFGAIYILVGILGFFVKSHGFAATSGGKLLGIFEVNPLHNIAHLLIGGALLAAGRAGLAAARGVNTAVGAAYLLLGVLGLFLLDKSANILALNGADNALHFASAVVLLGTGVAADKARHTTVA